MNKLCAWKGGIGIGQSYGTFGEILQGSFLNDEAFLVTMPVEKSSTARFSVSTDDNDLTVFPKTKIKSLLVAKKILCSLALPLKGKIELVSEIPEGKGMASSSADIVATVRAILDFYKVKDFSRNEIARIACEVEPTDGVMFDGHAVFAHRTGRLIDDLPGISPIEVIGIDEGGSIDTIEFNGKTTRRLSCDKLIYGELLSVLQRAFHLNDLVSIGCISTISAEMNQSILPKKNLAEAMEINRRNRGLGVIVAHSGTCLGVMLDPSNLHYAEQKEVILNELGQLGNLLCERTADTVGTTVLHPPQLPVEDSDLRKRVL